MVFESLLSLRRAEKSPALAFIAGIFYSSISLFLARYFMPDYASIVMVFFITLLSLPLFYNSFLHEEENDLQGADEKSLLKQHVKPILFFIYLFLGLTVSFAIWYCVLNSTTIISSSNDLFNVQLNAINEINGKATEILSASASVYLFATILGNNLKVMIYCLLFSFVFGAGAIFILTWNSSILGAAIGRQIVYFISATNGSVAWIYFKSYSCGFARYLVHGLPEIVAFFTAGLAGGIISAAIVKHDYSANKIEKIIVDATYLILIAVCIVIISAIIEVWVTPAISCTVS